MPLDSCVYFIALRLLYAVIEFPLHTQNWTRRFQ